MRCPVCNTIFTVDAHYCPNCGAKLCNDLRKRGTEKRIKSNYQPRKELRAAGRRKRHILLPVVGLGIVALILALCLFPFSAKTQEGFVYLKQGALYYSSAKNTEPIQLTKAFYGNGQPDRYFEYRMNYRVKFNQNRDRVFYPGEISEPGGTMDLYYLDLKNKGNKPERIAQNIWNYEINDAGTRVYYLNAENELYESNLSQVERIASEVSYFITSEDGFRLIYFDREGNLFFHWGDGDGGRIDSHTEFVDWTPDLSKIYYQKDDCVYLSVDGKRGERILTGVTEVLKIYETGEIYYLNQIQQDQRLKDFVEDDLLESDRKVIMPGRPEYPSYEDYRPDIPIPEEPGRPHDTDRKRIADPEIDQKTYDHYIKEMEHYNKEWDRLYQEALVDYDRAYEAYEAAEEVYHRKLQRDSLREDLEQEMIRVGHSTLYYYDTKTSVAVSDDYQRVAIIAEDRPAMVYAEYGRESTGKTKLSEITSKEEAAAWVSSRAHSDPSYYAAIGGISSELEQEQGIAYQFDSSLSYLYYMENPDSDQESFTLSRAPIRNSRLGTKELYEKEVSSYLLLKGYDSVWYWKGEGAGCGDLYRDKDRIDKEVKDSVIVPSESGNGFYYISDYDKTAYSGTLMYYDGAEAEEISEEVYDFHVLGDMKILCLKEFDLRSGAGELSLYHGDEISIDEEVSILIKLDQFFEYYGDDYLRKEEEKAASKP